MVPLNKQNALIGEPLGPSFFFFFERMVLVNKQNALIDESSGLSTYTAHPGIVYQGKPELTLCFGMDHFSAEWYLIPLFLLM